jgi:hypothetical protein
MVPIMVHESVPTATSYAFGSYPRRVFSIRYLLIGFFHGDSKIALRASIAEPTISIYQRPPRSSQDGVHRRQKIRCHQFL